MFTVRLLVSLVIAILFSTPGFANTELLKSYGCLSCHTLDRKLVGPSYQDIFKKYIGQKDAEPKLSASVKLGSKGTWGELAMPPNSNVKDEDIKAMVKWILAGPK